MAEVSQEMILDYMIGKGGVVKNVDLVRHFRKFLQLDDPLLKGMCADEYQTTAIMVKGMWLCHNGQCVFEVSVVKGTNCSLSPRSSQSRQQAW